MSTASVVLPESYRIELAHKAATKVNIAPVDAIQALVDAGFIVPLKK